MPRPLTSGEKLAWRSILEVSSSKDASSQQRLAALLLRRFTTIDQKTFERRLRAIYDSDSIQGPLAVGWAMRMMATQCEPGNDRDFFVKQMEMCKEDAAIMKRVKKGWTAFGTDPWWVVHSSPEPQIPRYNSEPIFSVCLNKWKN